jgi:hypothetical protein
MEQEIPKLISVVRRIARATRYIEWTRPGPDATQFCVAQYNRILARLTEIEPAVATLFTPLNDATSPEVIRMACRDLVSYFEVEESHGHHMPPFVFGCGPRSRGRWAHSAKCD